MQILSHRERRGEAWTEAKRAVRAYSRNPSDANETLVRSACSRLRETASVKAMLSMERAANGAGGIGAH